MRRAVVIINPLSGRGSHQRDVDAKADLARQVLGLHDIGAEVRPTSAAGDARLFALDALQSGCDLVVAWGGDGTVNEVATALVHSGTPLAIVPAGSGNGLASDLRIPFKARAALELAASGRDIAIDVGQVNDNYFVNIAGIGIDALIAARFAERGLRRRGPGGYLLLSNTELWRYQAATYTLTIDEDSIEQRAMLVAIANGRQYGNRAIIAPRARLDDGLLEVVVVEPLSMFRVACRLPSLFLGRLRGVRGVTMRSARHVRVRAAGPIPFHVDGEPRLARDELTVTLHPKALVVRSMGP